MVLSDSSEEITKVSPKRHLGSPRWKDLDCKLVAEIVTYVEPVTGPLAGVNVSRISAEWYVKENPFS
jgi:hypothetical protein